MNLAGDTCNKFKVDNNILLNENNNKYCNKQAFDNK